MNTVQRIARGLAALWLAGLLTAAFAQEQTKSQPAAGGQLSLSDKKFLKEAAQGGMAEVELGQLATEKAASNDVKKFGQRMVDDHSKANDELKQVASRKGVAVPSNLTATDQATKARLSKLSGDQFDKAYMADMVKDHKKDVAEFRRESKSANDPDVKNFAASTLPTLEDHLKQAEAISPAKTQTSAAAMPKKSQR